MYRGAHTVHPACSITATHLKAWPPTPRGKLVCRNQRGGGLAFWPTSHSRRVLELKSQTSLISPRGRRSCGLGPAPWGTTFAPREPQKAASTIPTVSETPYLKQAHHTCFSEKMDIFLTFFSKYSKKKIVASRPPCGKLPEFMLSLRV